MIYKKASDSRMKRLAGVLAGAVFAAFTAPAPAQSDQAGQGPKTAETTRAPSVNKDAAAPSATKLSPYLSQKVTHKAQNYYVAAWGVDKLKVSSTAAGNLIRFNYRVLDPARANALADKGATPYLVGQKNNVALQIPVMENVGQLRQTVAPQPGKEYWMVFSNKGGFIRRGDRVNVIIGLFRADGLMVE